MHSSLKKFQAWRSRRKLRSLERWEQIRAKGQARFVFKTALTYSLTVVGATHAYESFFHGTQDSIPLPHLILQFFVGLLVASSGWSNREDKYRDALIEAPAQASFGIKPPPHNKPGA